jgi:hypothetical protein
VQYYIYFLALPVWEQIHVIASKGLLHNFLWGVSQVCFPLCVQVLMNEWLNKSPELPSTPLSTVPPPLTSPILLRPSELPLNPTDLILSPQVADSYGYSTHHSPSKSLATLAQAANRVGLGSSTSTPHLCRTSLGSKGTQSTPGGGVGSAKKRWLRQAISEECDFPTMNSCASPNSRTGIYMITEAL